MVTTESGAAGRLSCFTIRPNGSLTAVNAKYFFIGISVFSITIALRFLFLGLWIILPLSIAELVLLGLCLRYAMRNSRQCETIKIQGDEVLVRHQLDDETTEWRFNAYWLRVRLEKDATNWYPSKLIFSSHGRELEVASFLTDEEREQLADDINMTLNELRQNSRQ